MSLKKKPTVKKKPQTTDSKKATLTQSQKIADAKKIFLDSATDVTKRSTMLTLDSFDNFISKVGLRNDNSLSGGTYTFNLITRNRILIEAAYRGSWVVGKMIDCIAEDMTREGIEISTNDSKDDLDEYHATVSRLKILQTLCFLIKMGRLYGGAIGVVQIEGQDLETPIDVETIAKDQFQGIIVYDRWQINPDLTDVIDSGPDIGLPTYYDIVNNPSQTDPTSKTSTGQLRVHFSRVFRYTGIDLPYFQAITELMWGESYLERLWDRLISYDNATMSAASLIDRANLRTVGIDGLREIIAAGGEAQAGLVAMFDMMRSMQTNEGLTLLDKNDTFATTSYTFAGLSDMLLQFGQQLSGACDTPMTRMFGQSPSGLNSNGDNDMRMYYDSVKAQQEAKLRGPWELLNQILWRSVFGKDKPEDLKFKFVPLWQMSALDKANIAKLKVDTVIEAREAGLMTTQAAMRDLQQSASELGSFSNITEEDINNAEEQDNEDPPAPGTEPEPSKAPEEKKEPPPVSKDSQRPMPGEVYPGGVMTDHKEPKGAQQTWFKKWLVKR